MNDLSKGHGSHPGSIDYDKYPFIVFWEVTRACKLACRHCRASAIEEPSENELDLEEGKELIDEISSCEQSPVLVFTGGDPLMRNDIFELIDYSVEKGLRTAFTPAPTSEVDKETIKRLKSAGVSRLALSLDGSCRETHDHIRGDGSYESIMKAAEISKEIGLPVQINTMVTKNTYKELEDIVELVEELDAVMWSLFFLVHVGRGQALESVTSEEAEEILNFLYEESGKRDFQVKTTEACHYRRVVIQNSDMISEEKSIDDIGRSIGVNDGNGVVFVSRDGDIYPSGFLPLKEGNVREDSLIEVYRNSEVFKDLRDKSGLKGECGICEFREICGGSRARAYATNGDYLAEDPLCSYNPEENTG